MRRCASHQFSRHAKQIPLPALTLDACALNFLRGAISFKSKSCVPAAEKKAQQAVPLSSRWSYSSISQSRPKAVSGLLHRLFGGRESRFYSLRAYSSISEDCSFYILLSYFDLSCGARSLSEAPFDVLDDSISLVNSCFGFLSLHYFRSWLLEAGGLQRRLQASCSSPAGENSAGGFPVRVQRRIISSPSLSLKDLFVL